MEEALKFQEDELKKYSVLSFSELSEMLGRFEISSPPNLESYSFARELKMDEYGGIEVSVYHYFFPETETPEWLKDACGGVEITLGESRFSRWFNISKSGKISWPSFEHTDSDD